MKIPSEIRVTLGQKFKKYVLVNFWENDGVYYLCIYSKKHFYFCRGHVNHVYPCSSAFIKIDKVTTLAEIKKEIRR